MCQDKFLLRVLLRNKCWLSGSVACSVTSFGMHCCSMYDWGCNGGSAYKHVFVILEGIPVVPGLRSSASSSSREPAAFVLDVEEGSSLTATCCFIASVEVLASSGTM